MAKPRPQAGRGQHPQGDTTAWSAWQSWAAEYRCKAIAGHRGRHRHLPGGPARQRAPPRPRFGVARAAIAKVHQVSGLADPTADSLCRDVLRRIGREGRHRGPRPGAIDRHRAVARGARIVQTTASGSLQALDSSAARRRTMIGRSPAGVVRPQV